MKTVNFYLTILVMVCYYGVSYTVARSNHSHQTMQATNTSDMKFSDNKSKSGPVIVSKPEEIVVAPGSNVTLACSAQGSQPLTFIWFQDERNLTKSNSTNLLEEKRYEIYEDVDPSNLSTSILYLMNLRVTDTSLFLCWVENDAGYTFENYSLVVNDSLSPGQAHLLRSLYQTPTFGADAFQYPPFAVIVAGLVIIILASTICVTLQLYNCRQDRNAEQNMDSKSTHSNDLKSSMNHEKSMSGCASSPGGGKFTPSTVDSADDEDEDDYDDVSRTSSCNKNNLRVLAVNDLDGFIEQMRSGIINMDYHSMSPVIQFNKNTSLNQTNTTNSASSLRPQSAIADQQQQFQTQMYHQQQYPAQPQPFTQAFAAVAAAAATQQSPVQAYSQQQLLYQQQQQQPFHHHLQQQQHQAQQPATHQAQVQQQPQSYHQLAYMNQFPSSSSSSSQTPFTNYGQNAYYY